MADLVAAKDRGVRFLARHVKRARKYLANAWQNCSVKLEAKSSLAREATPSC